MTSNTLFGKSLVSVGDLNLEEVNLILDRAQQLKEMPKPNLLNQKIIYYINCN